MSNMKPVAPRFENSPSMSSSSSMIFPVLSRLSAPEGLPVLRRLLAEAIDRFDDDLPVSPDDTLMASAEDE